MTRRGIPVFATAVLLVLSGCASVPSRPAVDDPDRAWRQRVGELSTIHGWEVKGKLGVKTHKRGGQANMLWKRESEDHDINLYGPLGGGRVVLTRTAEGATLRDSKKQTYHAQSAEELLYRVAGWRVPFGAMRYWVLGMPMPGEQYAESIDEWGRLKSLRQSGWEIEFAEYRVFDGRELPRKFTMTALPGTLLIADDQLGESDQVRVRVIIKRWRFN